METSRLLDLDGEHVRCGRSGEIERAVRTSQGLVRHNRHGIGLRKPCHGRAAMRRDGLLDEIASRVFKSRDRPCGGRLVPCLIDIDADARAIPKRLLDRGDMHDIVVD